MDRIYKRKSVGGNREAGPGIDDGGAIQRPSGQTYRRPRVTGYAPADTIAGIDHTLKQQEAQAAQTPSGDSEAKKALSPPEVGLAEAKTPGSRPEGLYIPELDKSTSLRKKIKALSTRRKAFGVLGVGGIAGIALTVLTIFPTYRLPSLMNAITSLTGAAVEEVIENRAGRYVIGYLIRQADVDAIAGDDLKSTLWRTFRAHRLEEKVKRETGFEWKKVDGKIRMFHQGRDLGVVHTYEDVIRLTAGDPKAQKGFRKVLKIASGKRWVFSSRMAQDALKRRFPGMRFSAPENNKFSTEAQNLANFHLQQFDAVDGQQREIFDKGLVCMLDDDCDFFKDKGDPAEGPSTDPVPESKKDDINQFADDVRETSSEAREDIKTGTENGTYKTSVDLTGVVQKRLTTRVLAYAGGPIGLLSTGATLYHFAYEAQQNNLMQKIPAAAVAYTTGAQAAFYSGQASNIMAGRTAPYFIADMNKQIQGAELAQTHQLISGGDTTKGVPVEAKVNNDVQSPLRELTNKSMVGYNYTIALPLQAWYAVENFAGDIISFFTGPAVEFVLKALFGEDYAEKFNAWLFGLVAPFFAQNVDAFATGAKWLNQVVVGWSANWNWYCEVYLGCRTTSKMKETLIPPELGSADNIPPSIRQHTREDMADLPLKDRLFSLDEPHSLLNKAIQSAPTTTNPITILTSVFRQVGSLPTTLLTAVSGQAKAATWATPQQIADITGVRQYGYLPQDLAHDISPEISTQAEPVCPEGVDQESGVNLCLADREVAKALLCWYTDCPEYSVGQAADEPSSLSGLVSNLRQQWSPSDASARVGW